MMNQKAPKSKTISKQTELELLLSKITNENLHGEVFEDDESVGYEAW